MVGYELIRVILLFVRTLYMACIDKGAYITGMIYRQFYYMYPYLDQ